jgi:single-strand DNA-binding protein
MKFNRVLLGGNLTRDPELKFVGAKNTALAKFGMAVNETYKASDGTKKERTVFVDVAAWGGMAEVIDKYLSKGAPIFIEGRLEFSQWEDKTTGQKRSKLSVVAEQFQFVGSKKDDSASESSDPDPEIPF